MSPKKVVLLVVLVLGVLGVQHYFSSEDHNATGNPTRTAKNEAYQEKQAAAIVVQQSNRAPPAAAAVIAAAPPKADVLPVVRQKKFATPGGVYALSANTIDGLPQPLGKYAGKVSIITNVVSIGRMVDLQ